MLRPIAEGGPRMHPLYASLPLTHYRRHEAALAELPVGLEILIDHAALAPDFAAERAAIAAALRAEGRPCRFHAPFRDLAPGGQDPEAVAHARRRLEAALELAPAFGVTAMTAHPAWEPAGYGTAEERAGWLARSVDFWAALGGRAAACGVRIDLENIFDRDPLVLAELLDALPPARFAWLLDVGHWHAFSFASLSEWLAVLGPRLASVHLHDNGGRTDDHRALGAGSLPRREVFAALAGLRRPLDWIFENRSASDLRTSLRRLALESGIAEFASLAGSGESGPASPQRS
jgi:sugar phosphate isomerase/epimerase